MKKYIHNDGESVITVLQLSKYEGREDLYAVVYEDAYGDYDCEIMNKDKLMPMLITYYEK